MKEVLLFIIILVTHNLYGQGSLEKKRMPEKQTSVNKVSKPALYKLSDPVNYTDFDIIINWNDDDIYISVDSVFQKSYSETERKVKVGLTKEEKASIFQTVKEIDFYNPPKKLEMRDDIDICPSSSTEIGIKIGENVHSVYDSSGLIKNQSIKARFEKLESLIREIIMEKEEIKKLPKSDKVYL